MRLRRDGVSEGESTKPLLLCTYICRLHRLDDRLDESVVEVRLTRQKRTNVLAVVAKRRNDCIAIGKVRF